jgi:hypothetical protein
MRCTFAICALTCIAAGGMGCGASNKQSVITVTIVPTSASVAVDKTEQFTASVSGTTNTAVTWSVVGGSSNGSISQTGLYSAPASVPSPAQVSVTATSMASTSSSASASAAVTITAASNIAVNVSPTNASVGNFETQQFTANVTGSTNTAVTWNVNGVAGGSQQLGFISSSGLYVAPGGVPTRSNGNGGSVATTVTVSAVSQADSSATGGATVTVVPQNQAGETGGIKLGTSGGNAKDSSTSGNTITCCSGTLGSLVTRGGTQYILSNNHVLARSDLGQAGGPSQPGDPIIEPGLVDTGTCTASGARTVANLSAFYNLETGTAPKIDAAIAQVVSGDVDSNGNILYLGATTDSNGVPLPSAPHAGSGVVANLGMAVAKSGRATGLTCSAVLAVAVNVNAVQYQRGCGTGTTFTVSYTNQVDISGGSFSAEGDSGSLIVAQSTADPVALLFGGSDTDTVGNPVADVLNFFATGGNNATFVGGGAHTVVGCSLPNKPTSATASVPTSAVSREALQKATAVRDAHAPELLARPEVQALGIGASYDNPSEAAIVLFVTKGQQRRPIPPKVDGVRTRVVEADLFEKRGRLSVQESRGLERQMPSADQVYAVSEAELERARAVHESHWSEQLNQPGVQGEGISSSLDAPGEAALMIFVVRGVAHSPIPAVIDGVRTRIRESRRFKAGVGDGHPSSSCFGTTARPKNLAKAAQRFASPRH